MALSHAVICCAFVSVAESAISRICGKRESRRAHVPRFFSGAGETKTVLDAPKTSGARCGSHAPQGVTRFGAVARTDDGDSMQHSSQTVPRVGSFM